MIANHPKLYCVFLISCSRFSGFEHFAGVKVKARSNDLSRKFPKTTAKYLSDATALLLNLTLVICFSVDCLSCYDCTSEDSWADCNSKMTKISCPSESPNCYKGVLTCTANDVTKTVFFKRCGKEGETCDTTREDTPSCPFSLSGWSYDFMSQCCSGDNCNSGSTLKISFVVNGACLVLLLLCTLTYIY